MKSLKNILYKVPLEAISGSTDRDVNAIQFDSRELVPGDVFVAIPGTVVDGHNYIDDAIASGAVAVVCQKLPVQTNPDVTYVQVTDSAMALAFMASNYYDDPSSNLKLIGVTGTNGKTTVTSLLFELFTRAGYKVGLISTILIRIGEKEYPTTHTTPDSITINRYLKMMNDAGVEYCFMEVSSHGIAQMRTRGLHFTGGIFTNLTHDHLDYHKTFAAYRNVKKSFFDDLPKSAFALVNVDDKNGKYMVQNCKARKYTYALKTFADYRAQILENQFQGLLLKLNESEVWTKLIGHFNAYNILAIYGAADLLGLERVELLRLISELESVTGRFQYLISEDNITAVVDYAHTPDALKKVLETINSIRTHNETLITVVGCGGDRDKAKRPMMAEIAASLSSKAIFTSDNPRSENPEAIIADMEAGLSPDLSRKTLSIVDRDQAIKAACQMAQPGDIILLAGKGHETYQEMNGERIEFDDYKKADAYLKQLQK